MPASFRSAAHAGAILGGDPTCNVPAGTQNGDLLIALCATNGAGATWTPPAGWTAHPDSLGGQAPLFTRTASSEPASYQFLVNGTGSSSVSIIAVKDWTAVDDVQGVAAASGNAVIPEVTSGGANRLLLQIALRVVSTSFTPPGTATERFDTTAPTSNFTIACGDEIVGAGGTGSRTWTPANSASGVVGYMLAIAPGDATVTVPAPAGATADAQAPVASAAASVAGVAAAATAAGQAPAASAGSSVAPPAAAATATTPNPEWRASVRRSPQTPAEATASSPFGGLVVSGSATIFAPTAAATVDAGVPAAFAGSTVAAVEAEATADAVAPAASAGSTVAGAPAAATASAPGPAVSAGSRVDGVRAQATASATDLAAAVETGFFDPPTQDQAMPDHFWGRFSIPVGISVVKTGAHYVNVPTPTHDELAGSEGTDWFRGGYHYEVGGQVAADLLADGYTLTKDAYVH